MRAGHHHRRMRTGGIVDVIRKTGKHRRVGESEIVILGDRAYR